jgi:uncharacterized membrane protein
VDSIADLCFALHLWDRYLVTTMSIVPRGTEGAVSLEGTLAGLLASVILSAIAYALKMVQGFQCSASAYFKS